MKLFPNTFVGILRDPAVADANNGGGSSPTPGATNGGSPPSDEMGDTFTAGVMKAFAESSAKTTSVAPTDKTDEGQDVPKVEPEEPPADTPPDDKDKQEPEEPENPDEEPPVEDGAPKPDPDEQLPFHDHPRWKEVIAERNRLTEANQELAPKAEQFDSIIQFAEKNQLSVEDLNEALDLAALLRKDPAAFRQRMEGFFNEMDYVSGTRLPADLQKAVDEGKLSVDYAKEIVKSRVEATQAKQQAQQVKKQTQSSLTVAIQGALNSWEDQKRRTDPGFIARLPLLSELVSAEMQRNEPTSARDALTMVERCYAKAVELSKSFRPAKPARKGGPSDRTSGHQPGTSGPMKSWPDFEAGVAARLAGRRV